VSLAMARGSSAAVAPGSPRRPGAGETIAHARQFLRGGRDFVQHLAGVTGQRLTAGVGRVPRACRSKSGVPTAFSVTATWRDTADCV